MVVLDNVPADALDRLQQDALLRYARDFGGSVLLLGGNHAFAAGGFGPTPLGAISPLSDTPPTPGARWIFLLDASGSMAAPGPAGSLFDAECAAARSLLPLLPPSDRVQVSAFGRNVQGWIDAPAASAVARPLPPPGTLPNGPTVLEPALRTVLSASDLPTHLLLMTDADTDPVDTVGVSTSAAAARARLSVLALGHGSALPSLAEVARRTGGCVVEQPSPAAWAPAAQSLLRAQLPDHLEPAPATVRFAGPAASLGVRQATAWNHTWLKRDAEQLAFNLADPSVPMAARWQVGTGTVAAVAFRIPPEVAGALADLFEAAPADPRFTVEWDTRHTRPRVMVTAVDADRYLDAQPLQVDVTDLETPSAPTTLAVPQIAPGRYAADLPPSTRSRWVRVRLGSHLLDRRALAGRYGEEFDAIGIDREKLTALASRCGGAVIEPSQTQRLNLSFAHTTQPLSNMLIGFSLLCITIGLWNWKRR